jgi:myxalamid-type polyketide synthase MxaE and MxaD
LVAQIARLSPERRALLARLLPTSSAAPRQLEPIAIIGMGCRFPNGAGRPESFWRLLCDGVDAVREIPLDRWDWRAYYDPDPEKPGRMNTRWGSFLEQVDHFDAAFFGISPREAVQMDPQHRLLLEVAFEALEDAGQAEEKLRGSRTGVFAAVYQRDYTRLAYLDPEIIDAYTASGTHHSLAANRLSYLLDLRGPSLVVDTACSSSLVAVHQACRSLAAGECQRAIVGAVNLVLSPEETLSLSRFKMMAPDGRCKTFDARADGFVRGEGAGAIVLKRLSDAQADGDEVLAVIRGTAVTQDGRSNGLTAPNVLAQQEVLRQALANAGLAPTRIGYVEAHGTGTALGDVIELEALREVLGQPRPDGSPCVIGAVKTNIGHLEAAAGIAGLIKTVLILRHGEIPPNLHLREPNPRFPLTGTPFVLPTERRPWPASAEPRAAGVSSFGMGGTNAHVILEEAPRSAPAAASPSGQDEPWLLPLSAHSPQALSALAREYQHCASAGLLPPLSKVCPTAARRRTHHEHRLAVVARNSAELAERLAAFMAGEARSGLISGRRSRGSWRGLVFIFPGQGSQWAGMGRQLMERAPAFRAAFERCDAVIQAEEGWRLLDLLKSEENDPRLARVDLLQPLLSALQMSLAAQWRAWGIEPDAVVGHSMGEVAAAHVAGALELEDAMRITARRSRLLARLHGQGAMLSVELPPSRASEFLAGQESLVCVAAHNGPATTVLAGDRGALTRLVESLEKQGVSCRWVRVDVASHSPAIEPLLPDLLQALRALHSRPTSLPFYSTVTGEPLGSNRLDADYWAQNLRQPVRFWPAIERLLADEHHVFVEVSPHPILLPALAQGLPSMKRDVALLPSMRRREDEQAVMLESLGALYTRGIEGDWSLLYPHAGRADLPPYPWQRERFWLPPRTPRASRPNTSGHPLLGAHQPLAPPLGHLWEGPLHVNQVPWLADHRVEQTVLLPGTAFVELALAAAAEAFGHGPHAVEDLRCERALFFPEGVSPTVQVHLSDLAGKATFQISSRTSPEADWVLHARGQVGPVRAPTRPDIPLEPDAVRTRCEEIPGAQLYQRFASLGNQWGPAFQSITRFWRRSGEVLAEISAPAAVAQDMERYQIHPALLDALGQALTAALPEGEAQNPFVMEGLERVVLHEQPGSRLYSHLMLRTEQPSGGLVGDVRAYNMEGRLQVEMLGLRLRFLDTHTDAAPRLEDWLYEIRWEPQPPSAMRMARPRGGWVILTGHSGVGAAVVARLEALGERVVRVDTREGAPPPAGTLQLSALDPAAVRTCLGTLEMGIGEPWRVVHLLGLDAPGPDEITSKEIEPAVLRACGSALHVLQALTDLEGSPRLWLATRGAQPVKPGPVAAAQAPLWGLGHTMAAEHPENWGGLVDLEPDGSDAEAAAALVESLFADDGETLSAWRQGVRYAARLARRPRPERRVAAPGFAPSATYLITGGLGGLGLHVARWLVEHGARRLILLGRTQAPPRQEWNTLAPETPLASSLRAVRELESMGASVHLASVDVGDEAGLTEFLENFTREGWPPIRGVFHAAGVQHRAPLRELDLVRLRSEMRAKVLGTWLLSRALRELDVLVYFSSGATLLGSPFIGGYAAANAFLDAFAHHRRSCGEPALSINWGFWSGAGMAERHARESGRHILPHGIHEFPPSQGLQALERLMAEAPAQAGVLAVDWPEWRRFHPTAAATPFLSALVREDGAAEVPERSGETRLPTPDLLRSTPSSERHSLLESYLRTAVARVLRLPPERIDSAVSLVQLGMDSLTAAELRNRIRSELGLTVPIVKVLACPGLPALAEEVLSLAQLAGEDEDWEELVI